MSQDPLKTSCLISTWIVCAKTGTKPKANVSSAMKDVPNGKIYVSTLLSTVRNGMIWEAVFNVNKVTDLILEWALMELAPKTQTQHWHHQEWATRLIWTVSAIMMTRSVLIAMLVIIWTWIVSALTSLNIVLLLMSLEIVLPVELDMLWRMEHVFLKNVTWVFVQSSMRIKPNACNVQTDLICRMDVVWRWMDIARNGFQRMEFVSVAMLDTSLTRTITNRVFSIRLNEWMIF